MEIRIEEHLTGHAYLEKILGEYGGLEAVKSAARSGNTGAKSDLADLELLLADGRRLLLEFKVSTVSTIEPGDLERLTPERLKLWASLSKLGRPTRMGTLVAKLGRDKKNVSQDVKVLKGLGLVEADRKGRETFVRSRGNEIRISLGS